MTEPAPVSRGDAVAEVGRMLAANLRAARNDRGWRLEDLALRSGVSRGMIHQIENNRTHPSITTITKLCVALDVPLTQLVELPPQIGRIGRRSDAIIFQHGTSEAALLLSDGRHELWHHELMPGDEIRDEGHPEGSKELIHVTSGTLVVEVGSATFTVPANDALTFRGDRRHAYRNDQRKPARYTVTVIYGGGHDDRYPIQSEHRDGTSS